MRNLCVHISGLQWSIHWCITFHPTPHETMAGINGRTEKFQHHFNLAKSKEMRGKQVPPGIYRTQWKVGGTYIVWGHNFMPGRAWFRQTSQLQLVWWSAARKGNNLCNFHFRCTPAERWHCNWNCAYLIKLIPVQSAAGTQDLEWNEAKPNAADATRVLGLMSLSHQSQTISSHILL